MTKFDRTQGDLKVFLTKEGADFDFSGGQPDMDTGLGTAAIMSLFSSEPWIGNTFNAPEERIGSRFESETQKAITVTQLENIRNAALADLQWMLDSGAASKLDVSVLLPAHDRLEVTVLITPPGSTPRSLQFTRYGVNWVSQETDPRTQRDGN